MPVLPVCGVQREPHVLQHTDERFSVSVFVGRKGGRQARERGVI